MRRDGKKGGELVKMGEWEIKKWKKGKGMGNRKKNYGKLSHEFSST